MEAHRTRPNRAREIQECGAEGAGTPERYGDTGGKRMNDEWLLWIAVGCIVLGLLTYPLEYMLR